MSNQRSVSTGRIPLYSKCFYTSSKHKRLNGKWNARSQLWPQKKRRTIQVKKRKIDEGDVDEEQQIFLFFVFLFFDKRTQYFGSTRGESGWQNHEISFSYLKYLLSYEFFNEFMVNFHQHRVRRKLGKGNIKEEEREREKEKETKRKRKRRRKEKKKNKGKEEDEVEDFEEERRRRRWRQKNTNFKE